MLTPCVKHYSTLLTLNIVHVLSSELAQICRVLMATQKIDQMLDNM